MSNAGAWLALTTAVLCCVWMSVCFRLGPPWSGFRRARLFRPYVEIYRDASQPAVVRNLIVVMPLISVGVLPVLIVMAPVLLGIQLSVDLPKWAKTLIAYGGFAYLFCVAGTALVLLSRPARVLPRWLADDDRRTGYVAQDLDVFDRSAMALGLLFVVGSGILFVVLLLAEGRLFLGSSA